MPGPALNSPVLNEQDFLRLTVKGLWNWLWREKGLPPSLPSADGEIAASSLESLGLSRESCLSFHQGHSLLFGLESSAPPKPGQTIGEYGEELRALWNLGERVIVFQTSGSTGAPKLVSHEEELLKQEVRAVTGLFRHHSRVLAAVPLNHSYGFIFGLLLPKFLKTETLDLPPLPTIINQTLQPGDLLVAFPLILSRLTGPFPKGVTMLSATAPCPDSLLTSLSDQGAEVVEIYGASETGAVGWRNGPGDFELLPHYYRQAEQNLTRLAPNGRGLITIPPLDKLSWSGDRHFRPAGRIDRAVQVAGINIYPEKIERLILECPQVKECSVRQMNPEEGERLKVFVALNDGADQAETRRCLLALFRKLSPPERPGSLKLGLELPRSPAGKITDWKI